MDLTSIQPFLNWLATNPEWVAITIAVIAFLESLAIAGIVIPGVLLLFGASAVAGGGTLGIWVALSSALIGAVLGDCLSFFLGKTLKDHIRDLWPFRKYPQWLNNGEKFFAKHGGKSVIIGRFVGPIRPVLPLVAGMLDMPALRFVSINFISALGWAPLYVLPGYLFGASLQRDLNLPEGVSSLGWLILAIAAGLFIFVRLSHWQLNPDSRLYQALHNWVDRQHNVRIFWHWLAENRSEKPVFPLLSTILTLIALIAFSFIWLPDTESSFWGELNHSTHTYFVELKNPWLDQLFEISYALSGMSTLIALSAPLVIWLLLKRHQIAALHIAVALCFVFVLTHLLFGVSRETAGATLVYTLLAAFIAQEMSHHQRWWIYGLSMLPVLVTSVSTLYLSENSLTETLAGIAIGLIICGATRISFSRHNRRPISADKWLIGCLLLSLSGMAIVLKMV